MNIRNAVGYTRGGNVPGAIASRPLQRTSQAHLAEQSQAWALSQYTRAFEEAKAANEARYQGILQGYRDRYDRGIGILEGMGDQSRRDIDASYAGQASRMGQDMVGRGLSGTTVAQSMQMGVERERQGAVGRLDESLRQQHLQTDAQLSGDKLGFMERRVDAYPDINQYMMQTAGVASPQPQGASLYARAPATRAVASQPIPQQVRYGGTVYSDQFGPGGQVALSAYDQARAAMQTRQATDRGAAAVRKRR